MKYFFVGLGSFVGGVVLTRLYFNKIIQLGNKLYEKAEKDYERALDFISRIF